MATEPRKASRPKAAVDLNRYSDETVLTTSVILEWWGKTDPKWVARLGAEKLPLREREHCYLAGEIKRAVLHGPKRPTVAEDLSPPAIPFRRPA